MFAGLRFIQNVVNHLKHKSHGFAPARQAIKRVGIGVRGVGAHAARGADQRASFWRWINSNCCAGLKSLEIHQACRALVRKSFQWWTWPVHAQCARSRSCMTAPAPWRLKATRRRREWPTPAEGDMGCCAAASKIVIVKRGQIVMHQTEGVDHFNGHRGGHGVLMSPRAAAQQCRHSMGRTRLPPPRSA